MSSLPSYVLVTPARNEAQFIELTIRSVVAQTVRPLRWVIVSDGSTDGTDDIVRRYTAEHDWIELVRMPERAERHFAGKVHAFNAGWARVRALNYEVIGALDGDASFDRGYFEYLLRQFAQSRTLGVAGTPFQETDRPAYDYRFVSIEHVSGICQLFRRECFEAIGGYTPAARGGVDHIAVVSARMKGWRTRTFTEMVCLHHRTIGTADRSVLSARLKVGQLDYLLGAHPAWEVFRVAYQAAAKRPFVVGGLAIGMGYAGAAIRRMPKPVSREFVSFRRREQMRRLRHFLARFRGPGASANVNAPDGPKQFHGGAKDPLVGGAEQ